MAPCPSNPAWFGAAVSRCTGKSPELPKAPFPEELAKVVEEHVSKATLARQKALQAIREATGADIYDETLAAFHSMSLEGDFAYDTGSFPIRQDLLASCSLPKDMDLSVLHCQEGAKDLLLRRLTEAPQIFQASFDRFVRGVCAKRLAELAKGVDCIYYQAFPCLRIVQPGEFSIGPHADVAYGHHPCSINFYVPLTPIGKTSSLFLESSPGSADWHPIVGDYGHVKHFAGAVCAHWTTENNTEWTRVSLDVRLICGPMFRALKPADENKDLFHPKKPGYYLQCHHSAGSWPRIEEPGGSPGGSPSRPPGLPRPDARFGFPWTVKDWEKVRRKG